MSGRELTLGAVSYRPRVVTIWERFRTYFGDAGLPTDYVLFSNYERLVEAVLAGTVDIGWNTNTAYVALDHRAASCTPPIGAAPVPSRPTAFLPHVNPQPAELVLWLSSHIHDEARHIEVFTKRNTCPTCTRRT